MRTTTTGYYDYGKGVSSSLAAIDLSPYGVSYRGSSDKTKFGRAAGVGAEWAFTSNWSAKLEWLHYDLGTTRHTVLGDYNESTIGTGFSAKVRHSGDLVRGGLNYSLGSPTPAQVLARY